MQRWYANYEKGLGIVGFADSDQAWWICTLLSSVMD